MDDKVEDSTRPRSYHRILMVGGGVAVLLLAGVLLTQNPNKGPLTVLLLLFLVFLLVFLLSAAALQLVSRRVVKVSLSYARTFYTAVALAAGVVYVLGLQTLGQLQIIDLALVIIFEVLLNFYLLRRF